jgi:hypothetical protein
LKSVAILSLANLDIQQDSRVLRQVKYLSRVYPVEVITYGNADSIPYPTKSISVVGSLSKGKWGRRFKTIPFLSLARFWPEPFYEKWYWDRPGHREALDKLKKMDVAVINANDWWTLPVAVEAAKENKARIILDLHEYALDEFNEVLWWRFLYKPLVRFFFEKYLHKVDASVTVNSMIGERYSLEFGLSPVIVMNAPEIHAEVGFHETDPDHIKLISHGIAGANRHLDLLVEAIAKTDKRFSLTFMVFGDTRYIDRIKKLADRIAPGRVFFIQSVAPANVITEISKYDLGAFLLKPEKYNNLVALPNKFFEFVSAGLGVCIGPSPAMAQIALEYEFGRVSSSFDPDDFARMLSSLSYDEIDRMKRKALEARHFLNADVEMQKLLDLYQKII